MALDLITNWLLQNQYTIIVILLALIFGFIIITILRRFLFSYLEQKQFMPKKIRRYVIKLVTVFFWFFVLLFVVNQLNLQSVLASLIAAGAIIGLAVAFSINTLLNDFFASFSLLADKHFNAGDKVKIIGALEEFAEIREVGLRKTRLKMKNGDVIVLGNAFINDRGWILKSEKKKLEAK